MLWLEEHCKVFVVIFLICLEWTSATGLGPCPKVKSMDKLNLTKFSGHWHEIERTFYLMELIRSCVTVDISELSKDRLGIVVNTKSTWTGTFSISEGVASPTRRDPNIFQYKVSSSFPRIVNRYLPGAGFYQVLDTDYDTYAVVYSCSNWQVVHSDLIWIWGRKREIDVELRSELYRKLNNMQLDPERLVLSKTTNCTDSEDFLNDDILY
nr:apolipoprotein D-like [Leptinotarsa decemlineata]